MTQAQIDVIAFESDVGRDKPAIRSEVSPRDDTSWSKLSRCLRNCRGKIDAEDFYMRELRGEVDGPGPRSSPNVDGSRLRRAFALCQDLLDGACPNVQSFEFQL